MRKANQVQMEGELVVSDPMLDTVVSLLDVSAKVRSQKQSDVTNVTRQIRTNKMQITQLSKRIGELDTQRKVLQKELDETPVSETSKDSILAQLTAISKLPWVAKAEVTEIGHTLLVDTRAGALKTVFHKRLAYDGNDTAEELLPEPLKLDMPTYQIRIDLRNMGGNWDRSGALMARLLDTQSLHYMPDSSFPYRQGSYAHWASNESYWYPEQGRQSEFSGLCLNDYRSLMTEKGKLKLIDLLNEVVIFLQSSGWANAYRPKLRWAVTLGFQPYTHHLTRKLGNHESFDDIQDDLRTRLPKYLKENGITQHMYDYGTMGDEGSNETERVQRAIRAIERGERWDEALIEPF